MAEKKNDSVKEERGGFEERETLFPARVNNAGSLFFDKEVTRRED